MATSSQGHGNVKTTQNCFCYNYVHFRFRHDLGTPLWSPTSTLVTMCWCWWGITPPVLLGTCCFTSVRSVCVFCPIHFCQRFLSCRRSNTKHWPNARLMLAHRLRCWANISPVLGYCVVFGATLDVGQCHRLRASINPALVQSIMPLPAAYRCPQHKVLLRTEWILASTGDAGPTFSRHWVGVCL